MGFYFSWFNPVYQKDKKETLWNPICGYYPIASIKGTHMQVLTGYHMVYLQVGQKEDELIWIWGAQTE